ncbi:phosphoribosyltransferase family protein [Curtobacterium sp. MCBD17_032]|uniref:phosphoribosyltransferase family protein n=1 Tax=Curtobacterium sp. MCBD17_032 TaxID=2175659 RepID=UPI000DA9C69B|nr:phosphoribosyltransferase family protein [Curtobacterium sp. MCBD17_032]PZE84118.1 phosphoribosyltransferase [Curtobacterium sp. MCBD17_032]
MTRDEDAVERARRAVLRRFRWLDGDADTWSVLADPDALAAVVAGLAALVAEDRADLVLGIEARGFVLGPAVALALGVGFVPVRKDGALFPGPLVRHVTDPDYRGRRWTLATRRDLVRPGQRVVLVDDWIETGGQATAAAALVDACGGTLVSVAVVVDEASAAARDALPPIRHLVRAADL